MEWTRYFFPYFLGEFSVTAGSSVTVVITASMQSAATSIFLQPLIVKSFPYLSPVKDGCVASYGYYWTSCSVSNAEKKRGLSLFLSCSIKPDLVLIRPGPVCYRKNAIARQRTPSAPYTCCWIKRRPILSHPLSGHITHQTSTLLTTPCGVCFRSD